MLSRFSFQVPCAPCFELLRYLKEALKILPFTRKPGGVLGVVLSNATRASAAICPKMGMITVLGCMSRAHAICGHPYAIEGFLQPWVALESSHSAQGGGWK